MLTLPIYNSEGKEIDSVKLDAGIFDGVINEPVIYQVINAYRANQRKGLASTKTRGEVSGGGRKPWRQKGTGRSRVGSIRSPLWRHGGVIFGPHPRDFSYGIPAKLKNIALKSSLNAKLKENNVVILDNFKIEKNKTKEALQVLKNLKLNPDKRHKLSTILLLMDKVEENLKLSLRNISFLDFNRAGDTNTYEVMSHQKLIITKEGLKVLSQRFKK